MNSEDRERFIASILRHQPGTSDADYESVEELDEIVQRDPVEALRLLEELFRRAPSAESRSYLAAGPLENLVRRASDEFFSALEAVAARSPEFKTALGEVWVGEEVSPQIRARLEAFAQQH